MPIPVRPRDLLQLCNDLGGVIDLSMIALHRVGIPERGNVSATVLHTVTTTDDGSRALWLVSCASITPTP